MELQMELLQERPYMEHQRFSDRDFYTPDGQIPENNVTGWFFVQSGGKVVMYQEGQGYRVGVFDGQGYLQVSSPFETAEEALEYFNRRQRLRRVADERKDAGSSATNQRNSRAS